jgi:hypothetical protein
MRCRLMREVYAGMKACVFTTFAEQDLGVCISPDTSHSVVPLYTFPLTACHCFLMLSRFLIKLNCLSYLLDCPIHRSE